MNLNVLDGTVELVFGDLRLKMLADPVDTMLTLHRRHDAGIHFARLRTDRDPTSYVDALGAEKKLGKITPLGVIPIRELRSRWPFIAPTLERDSYFTVNSVRSTTSGREAEDVHFLNALKLDLDWHGDVAVPFAEMVRIFFAMLAMTPLPKPNLFVRSGHGVWGLWILRTPEHRDQIQVYYRVNDALIKAFHQLKLKGCMVDRKVKDAPRLMRVPLSFNSGAGSWVDFFQCSLENHTLTEFAHLLGIAPTKTSLSREQYAAAGRMRWSRPLRAFCRLWEMRGHFHVGARHSALFVLCYLGRRNHWTEVRIREQAERLAADCDPPLTVEDIDDSLRSSAAACLKGWECSIRNHTICSMLRATPGERRLFIPGTTRESVLAERRGLVDERRALIFHELEQAGRELSTRELQRRLLEKHGVRISHVTIASDLTVKCSVARSTKALRKRHSVTALNSRRGAGGKTRASVKIRA